MTEIVLESDFEFIVLLVVAEAFTAFTKYSVFLSLLCFKLNSERHHKHYHEQSKKKSETNVLIT